MYKTIKNSMLLEKNTSKENEDTPDFIVGRIGVGFILSCGIDYTGTLNFRITLILSNTFYLLFKQILFDSNVHLSFDGSKYCGC